MPSRIVLIDPARPRDERVAPAVEVLRDGGIVAVPTETFYGLAADSGHADAVVRVNRLKGKPDDSPCLLLIADVGQAAEVAVDLPESFFVLSRRFWPGPLTLVVPARPDLPVSLTGGRGRVAVRVPGLPLPRRLARELGRPITGVSANLHEQLPCRTAADVARVFPEGLQVILDGGPAPGGLPSTVLDLCETPPRVLREGAIPRAPLRNLFPDALFV